MPVYEVCLFLAVLPLAAFGVLVPFLARSRKALLSVELRPKEFGRASRGRTGECVDIRAESVGHVNHEIGRHGAKAPPNSSFSGQFDRITPSKCPIGRGSPPDADNTARVPLYTAQFAADPHSAYARMRAHFGALVPVWLAPGVPATLVIGYWTALKILNDPGAMIRTCGSREGAPSRKMIDEVTGF